MSTSRLSIHSSVLSTALLTGLGLLAAGWATPGQAQTVHAVVTVESHVRADTVARRLLQLQRDGEISNLVWVSDDRGQGAMPTAILDFNNESSYARWMAREVPRLGDHVSIVRADLVAHKGEASRDGVLRVNVYQLVVGADRYREYATSYLVPLMERQRDAGPMNDYAIYLERDTAEGKGRAITLTGYRSVQVLDEAGRVKAQAKAEMSVNDQAYRQWSSMQSSIRTPVSESYARFAQFGAAGN